MCGRARILLCTCLLLPAVGILVSCGPEYECHILCPCACVCRADPCEPCLDCCDPHYYEHRGDWYRDRGWHEEAIADYNTELNKYPRNIHAYAGRGISNVHLGDDESAIANFSRVIALGRTDADAYLSRGIARQHNQEYEKAIADYGQVLQRRGKHWLTYYMRALAHYDIEQYEKAWADVYACQKLGGTFSPDFLQKLRWACRPPPPAPEPAAG